MTHWELLLEILKDGKPHSIFEILERGKGMNWAVRSRLSDLRKKGYKIDTLFFPETKQNAWYQLKEISATGKSDNGYPVKSPAGQSKTFSANLSGISSLSEKGGYQTFNRPRIVPEMGNLRGSFDKDGQGSLF